MNKKIIVTISVALAVVCLSSFVGFNIYNNKKVEAQAQEQNFEREYATATPLNEKNNDGDYKVASATQTANQDFDFTSVQVVDFFNKAIQMAFNIPDTSNMQDINTYEKNNFTDYFYNNVISNYYKTFKKVEIENYKIISVKQVGEITTKNAGDFKGVYAIDYSCNIKEDGKADILQNDENVDTATALIGEKDGKLVLIQFTTSQKDGYNL